ncbi:MAG: PEP-CTERM sorting domain-containing protein, partial [Candidatus Tectomicrobia bacterium]
IFTPVAGQILTSTGFDNTFTANFDNLLFGTGTGSNDSASTLTGTPEPSTILHFITGLGILGGYFAWRQRARA